MGEKFHNYIFRKGLISKTYIKNSYNSKTSNPITNRQNTGIDSNPKMYILQTST